MSDQWGPTNSGDGSEWARPDGPTPPPAATEAGPVEPPLTLESEQIVRHRPGVSGRVVAGIVGVLVLLGGTLFAVTSLGSSGPASAEDAVRELLDAASDEDVLGVLAALDPGERDALRGPVEDLFEELERLEVLDPEFDLAGIEGLDLSFDDVQLRAEPVRDDIVRIYFTGGTVTGSYDADAIPLGDFVHDTLDRLETDISGQSGTETSPISESDDTFLVARNGSDGWRVSIGYTIAEAARLDAGLPMTAGGLDPIGAESPEAAVEGMLRTMADLDLAGTIARLSPGEMAALHDYAPLFLDRAQRLLDEESADLDVTVDRVELRSDTDDDRATVFVDAFAITATYEGESVSISLDEQCVTISGDMVDDDIDGTPFADGPVCADELTDAYDDMIAESGVETEGLELPEFPPFETPEVGITTARVGGEWYVAPVETWLDATVEMLRVVERAHLDAFVEAAEQLFFGFGFGYHETFEEVPGSLDGEYYEAPDPILPDGYDEFEEDLELDPGPTTTWQYEPGTAKSYDPTVLYDFASQVAGGDPDVTFCLEEVLPLHDEIALVELLDSWQYGYEPSAAAQQLLRDAMSECGVA